VLPVLVSLQHTLANYASLQELLDQELVYVAQQVQRAPDNESAWNYLWGMFALPGCPQHEMGRQDKVSMGLLTEGQYLPVSTAWHCCSPADMHLMFMQARSQAQHTGSACGANLSPNCGSCEQMMFCISWL